jgi:hypothetical protein
MLKKGYAISEYGGWVDTRGKMSVGEVGDYVYWAPMRKQTIAGFIRKITIRLLTDAIEGMVLFEVNILRRTCFYYHLFLRNSLFQILLCHFILEYTPSWHADSMIKEVSVTGRRGPVWMGTLGLYCREMRQRPSMSTVI